MNSPNNNSFVDTRPPQIYPQQMLPQAAIGQIPNEAEWTATEANFEDRTDPITRPSTYGTIGPRGPLATSSCPDCGKPFQYARELRRHRIKHFKEDIMALYSEHVGRDMRDAKQQDLCKICHKPYDMVCNLILHLGMGHGFLDKAIERQGSLKPSKIQPIAMNEPKMETNDSKEEVSGDIPELPVRVGSMPGDKPIASNPGLIAPYKPVLLATQTNNSDPNIANLAMLQVAKTEEVNQPDPKVNGLNAKVSQAELRREIHNIVMNRPRQKIKFRCRECGKHFTRRSAAVDHLGAMHCRVKVMARYAEVLRRHPPSGALGKGTCGICQKDMVNEFRLARHLAGNHKLLPLDDFNT